MNLKQGHYYTFITLGMIATDRILGMYLGDIDGKPAFKEPKKRNPFYLKSGKDTIVLEGEPGELSLIRVDTDRPIGIVRMNACMNFVTDDPEKLKEFLKEKNLNPDFSQWYRILFFPTNHNAETEPFIPYAEGYTGHAVVDRHLRNQNKANV